MYLPGFLYEAVADEHRGVDARQRATVRRRRRSVVLLLLTQRLTERGISQLERCRVVVVIVLRVDNDAATHRNIVNGYAFVKKNPI